MSKTLTITKDKLYPFDDYLSQLSNKDLAMKKLDECDFLILPSGGGESEYAFPNETINFVKFTRKNQSEYTIDILSDDTDITNYSYHSDELILPTIYIFENVLLPIAITLICSYVCETVKRRKDKSRRVRFTIIERNKDGSERELYYDGDSSTLNDILNKFLEKNK